MRAFFLALAILFAATGAAQAGGWRIVKDHWSAEDEAGFGRFVTALGESNCGSSQSCLRDKSNPWRGSDERFKDVDVDCAKFPYLLRAYYAWKNGLPFGYVDAISGSSGDLRFTKTANKPVSRREMIDRGNGIDGPSALRAMLDSVFSGTYRTDAAQKRGILSDFYSPDLKPGSIHPGSLVYDINGHVGIVWKVDDDGRIYYMDSHPDFTVTRSVYGAQFGQSPARLGGGLKNWRPFKLVGYRRDGQGHLIGGHLVYAQNDQIADYSLVQYVGTEPNPSGDVKKAHYVYNGQELGFYEYIRVAVSGGRMDFNPIYELKATMTTLCNDLKDRAQYVDNDINDGIAHKPHPGRLPDNIYGSDNLEWETYSTPSRDARIKAAFAQFYRDMQEMIDLWVHRDSRIVYDGLFLQKDLAAAYASASQACTITYLNSAKRPVSMTFDDIVHRLFAFSFDPYHCIELRWGASGAERETCPDARDKRRWYEAEQRLRNQSDRTYDAQMGFSIAELNDHVRWSGIDTPPPIDIKSLIDTMPDRIPFVQPGPGGMPIAGP
ncbi:MAG: hypothetical protein JSR60_09985 [Proteobacteria bacterium]|nr:hypothetical protein [Pseudomonadota bacterium]